MPICFQLFPNGSDEPARLPAVDDAICAHLGVEPHDTQYRSGWFDSIGFRLALGKSWDEIRADFTEHLPDRWAAELLVITDFLEANYSPNSWRQVGS